MFPKKRRSGPMRRAIKMNRSLNDHFLRKIQKGIALVFGINAEALGDGLGISP